MSSTTSAEAPSSRRWLALGLIAAAQFMVIMDTSIIGVALPEMQADLGFTPQGLSWVFNAYVVAFEEFTRDYDYQDVTFIIRNVRAAGGGPEIGLQNLDGAPFSDRLVLSRIGTPDPDFPNFVHDRGSVRIWNTGTSALSVTQLNISGAFTITNMPSLPLSIAPGDSFNVGVRFTATAGDIRTGTLDIVSNDADEPTKSVQLRGFWQSHSEKPA